MSITGNPEKDALNAIKITCKRYKVAININFNAKKELWFFKCMGKTFYNQDFNQCTVEAVKFIYNAHEEERF
jgi:hypothetical protein